MVEALPEGTGTTEEGAHTNNPTVMMDNTIANQTNETMLFLEERKGEDAQMLPLRGNDDDMIASTKTLVESNNAAPMERNRILK